MKILVFGHPRSGSSLAAHVLLDYFKLEGLGEIFSKSDAKQIDSKLDLIRRSDDILIKVLSADYNKLDLTRLDLDMFDRIYICERRNKVHAMLSMYAALRSNLDFWQNLERFQFTVKKSFMVRWGKQIHQFYQYRDHILRSGKSYTILYYEDMVTDHRCILAGLEFDEQVVNENYRNLYISKSKFDYARDCLNYDEACRWISRLG